MPEDGFLRGAGAAVVEVEGVAIDRLVEAEAPERRSAPFASGGLAIGSAVCQFWSHVVDEEIGEGLDGLLVEFREGVGVSGGEAGGMAIVAADLAEEVGSAGDGGVVG